MSQTKQVETVHGSVSYNTVECVNCGTEVHEDEAIPVKAGKTATGDRPATPVTSPQGVNRNMCEYCANEVLDFDSGLGRGAIERTNKILIGGVAFVCGSLLATGIILYPNATLNTLMLIIILFAIGMIAIVMDAM